MLQVQFRGNWKKGHFGEADINWKIEYFVVLWN